MDSPAGLIDGNAMAQDPGNSFYWKDPTRRRELPNRFSEAREAYRKGDVRHAEAAHRSLHLEAMLRETGLRGQYLADSVLGATDGIVTTFAIVAGAAGAGFSAAVVLIMGCANLIADGLSMSAGNYLGARSQQQYWDEERRREAWEIENIPAAETEEIRRLYREKGFHGRTLERIVKTITGDKKRWLEEMMREELGILESRVSPLKSGLATFASFILAGSFPLLPYVLGFLIPLLAANAFSFSVWVTLFALFGVGVARTAMTQRAWWKSGLEILLIGGTAAGVAFAVGRLLRAWVG